MMKRADEEKHSTYLFSCYFDFGNNLICFDYIYVLSL